MGHPVQAMLLIMGLRPEWAMDGTALALPRKFVGLLGLAGLILWISLSE